MAQIQIRTRAARDSGPRARDLIHQIDRLFIDMKNLPFFLGGAYVMNVERFGGPPFYLATDHKARASYASNYLIQVARHP